MRWYTISGRSLAKFQAAKVQIFSQSNIMYRKFFSCCPKNVQGMKRKQHITVFRESEKCLAILFFLMRLFVEIQQIDSADNGND